MIHPVQKIETPDRGHRTSTSESFQISDLVRLPKRKLKISHQTMTKQNFKTSAQFGPIGYRTWQFIDPCQTRDKSTISFSALAVFSVVGIWCIVYGVLTLPAEKETGYVKELCDLELVMCPKCNSGCPFYSGKSGAKELISANQKPRKFSVKEKCSASVLLHVFDNNNTGKLSNMTS